MPQCDFDKLNARFGFNIDAAASEANAKLPKFHTEQNCGLAASRSGHRVYCNPPYSSLEPWCVTVNNLLPSVSNPE